MAHDGARWRTMAARLMVGCSMLLLALCTQAQNTFTYQGRLTDGGLSANGSYDFQFQVWNALTGGAQIGPTITNAPVSVSNGVFTVALDFGAGVFNGGARWLALGVRNASTQNPFAVLAPRQPITAAPYALYALTSAGTTDASGILTGTLNDARLSANIARLTDLVSTNNALIARLAATNAALTAQISAVSNHTLTNISSIASLPVGATLASIDPGDATLLGQGYQRIVTTPAPAWMAGSLNDAPFSRTLHTAAWTGSELLVWGGATAPGAYLASGAGYRPDTDLWNPISTVGAPFARSSHTAVWTGGEMIVWGGFGASGYLGTGGRFTPSNQLWTATATASAPTARDRHVALWTGSRMLIWGGRNASGVLSDGATYSPVSNVWSTLALAGAPAARQQASVVWTGSRAIIWGGDQGGELNSGAQLLCDGSGNPTAWQAMSTTGAPTPRRGHVAVWTGSRMIVWGGASSGAYLGDGASYDPVADTWTALPTTNAPSARTDALGIWTGVELIVFAGEGSAGALNTGAAFNPVLGKWRTLTNGGSPLARAGAAGAWTGTELILFGGTGAAGPVAPLERLQPQPAWHLFSKP